MGRLNQELLFTLTQALQLVGLAPSLFVIAFLLTVLRTNRQVVVPILYFISLSCCFLVPLLELYPDLESNYWVVGSLLLGESMLVALCFLLVCQFITGGIPPKSYWLVLLIPIVGGGLIVDSCFSENCHDLDSIKTLYHIFSSSLLFLLLVIYSSHISNMPGDAEHKKHKYWLVVVLILLHLSVLGVDLLRIAEMVTPANAALSIVLLRLTFIYLVLTSLFRVFYPELASDMAMVIHTQEYDTSQDGAHVARITQLMERDHLYREMRLSRADLADKIGMGEHQLSRVINHHFGKNFNDLINGYRIEEAKQRLALEPDQQVTVIGFEVGFNSIASFNRVFKAKVGMSPTEYRAKGTSEPALD